jgi:hypothetical protein
MSKAIDKLSKELAQGVSRRQAIWSFLTGVGAVGALGVLTGKQAKADSHENLLCLISCSTQAKAIMGFCNAIPGNNVLRQAICSAIASEFSADCNAASANKCVVFQGTCALYHDRENDSTITASSYTDYVGGYRNWICVPVNGAGGFI